MAYYYTRLSVELCADITAASDRRGRPTKCRNRNQTYHFSESRNAKCAGRFVSLLLHVGA